MSKLPGRIPFEDVEKFRNWAVPKVNGRVLASAEQEAKKARMANMPKQDNETIEEISAEQVTLGPMTAEQLAQITEEASREGFNQGYDEGLEKGLATGERQGYEQGKAEALAEWSGRLKTQAEQLAATCANFMDPLAQQQERLINEMLNLSVLLAKQLLDDELSQNPGVYWQWVEQALSNLPTARKGASVYFPPEIVSALTQLQPAQLQHLTIVSDPNLTSGTYRIEAGPAEMVFDAASRLQTWRASILPKADLEPVIEEFPIVSASPAGPEQIPAPITQEFKPKSLPNEQPDEDVTTEHPLNFDDASGAV